MRRILCAAVVGLMAVPVPALADHRGGGRDQPRYCQPRYDCDGGSDGNSGGDYEGGRSGDTDQRGDHNCRNFCFYGIPAPGEQPPEGKR